MALRACQVDFLKGAKRRVSGYYASKADGVLAALASQVAGARGDSPGSHEVLATYEG